MINCCNANLLVRILALMMQEQHVKNSLIPGFVRATVTVTIAFFPPPRVPSGYVPVHHPTKDAEAALPAGDPEAQAALTSLPYKAQCASGTC